MNESKSKKAKQLFSEEFGKTMLNKCSLERHRRSVHEGLKYPCQQCEYQATRKESLD